MSEQRSEPIWGLMGLLFRAHPWHGVPIGSQAPELLTAYIEIVPTDTVKYEIDKFTGILKVDRPQKYSSVPPTLYGFIPRTLCDEHVASFCMEKSGLEGIVGDHDPMDICVLTEKHLSHGDILLQAIPIGGLRMIDHNEADDKIIAVMRGDASYGAWTDISDCPSSMVERLKHYFLTYKDVPGEGASNVQITHVYGRDEALEVIRRSQRDYRDRYGGLENLLNAALRS